MGKGDKDEVLTMEDVVEAPVKLNSRCLHTWEFLEVAEFFKKNFLNFLNVFFTALHVAFQNCCIFIAFYFFCFVLFYWASLMAQW